MGLFLVLFLYLISLQNKQSSLINSQESSRNQANYFHQQNLLTINTIKPESA